MIWRENITVLLCLKDNYKDNITAQLQIKSKSTFFVVFWQQNILCTHWNRHENLVWVLIRSTHNVFFFLLFFFNKSMKNYLDTLLILCPTEPGYTLPLKTVYTNVDPDQMASKKPTDLNLHCLPFSMFRMWIRINNLNQVIWLAENLKKVWHLYLFSRTRVNCGYPSNSYSVSERGI